MAHGFSCSEACGIFPDQGSNPCPLHWQTDSKPLCRQGSPTPLISFSKIFLGSVYKFFISLVKVIPRYFILLDAIINRIVSLIFFLNCSLLVYKNKTDFCVLIIYPAILPNLVITSISFPWDFLYIESCHRQIEIVCFFLSNVGAFYFFFLPNCSG